MRSYICEWFHFPSQGCHSPPLSDGSPHKSIMGELGGRKRWGKGGRKGSRSSALFHFYLWICWTLTILGLLFFALWLCVFGLGYIISKNVFILKFVSSSSSSPKTEDTMGGFVVGLVPAKRWLPLNIGNLRIRPAGIKPANSKYRASSNSRHLFKWSWGSS